MKQRISYLLYLPAAFFILIAQASNAQTYPDRTIKIIVPFATGGPTDIMARVIGQKLSTAWGQAVVVENKPGGSGNVGVAQVSKANPDGYTLLVTSTSIAVNVSLFNNPGYDLDKSLIPVVNIGWSPNVIIANNNFDASNLKEALQKAKSGKLNYASPGLGTTPHLTAEYLFKVLAKVNVTPIPYSGAGPAVNAAMTGETEFASTSAPPAIQLIKTGRVKGLAITSSKRLSTLPDTPTLSESGYPGFEDYTWIGIFAPGGTPPAIINKINASVESILAEQEFRDRLTALGFDPVGGSPASFSAYVKSEVNKWAKVIKETGAIKE
ncbi:tripartite tricarboxylate transporter substrate binding protein [Polynucleobacter sp. Latsch14-2]|uniref:Bug family tripartite tricarboxylate transporter substrate binding protein n=1 Tax=Polynucleobacter sp. Latsch14-2 TaxID=2576920 RepID=UPI001C0BF860|nr:tripartite tricarboxylate transporter substrate binding protein [Polynucleobacter sp. Latsch14-2]MBU3614300.1 tripartite tricarboxylate transporter substrate binding protein [Polynucleobacter sp. Latsch14-2]